MNNNSRILETIPEVSFTRSHSKPIKKPTLVHKITPINCQKKKPNRMQMWGGSKIMKNKNIDKYLDSSIQLKDIYTTPAGASGQRGQRATTRSLLGGGSEDHEDLIQNSNLILPQTSRSVNARNVYIYIYIYVCVCREKLSG